VPVDLPAERKYREALADINRALREGSVEVARGALRGLIGEIPVFQTGKTLAARLTMRPGGLFRNRGSVLLVGSGGVLWTCSIFPLFAPKGVRRTALPPSRCSNGHELTPDNLVSAERGTRWRCRQCGADRAASWRRRRTAEA
jgi:hypothetical protein